MLEEREGDERRDGRGKGEMVLSSLSSLPSFSLSMQGGEKVINSKGERRRGKGMKRGREQKEGKAK